MNSISISGRLAADAEVRYAPSGDAVCEFRVADDVGYGEKKTTNWWRCSAWKKDKLAPYLTKGKEVTVFGSVELRKWTNKEGVEQLSCDIRVNDVSLHGGRSDGDTGSQPYGAPQTRPSAPPAQSAGGRQQNAARGDSGRNGEPAFPSEASGMDDVPF